MLFCLLIGITSVSFCKFSKKQIVKGNSITIDFTPEVISISDVTEEILSDFFMGEKPSLAVECAEGKSLPCTIAITGDMLKLNSAEISNAIKTLKTFYVRSTKDNGWLFSKNLKDWYRFYEFFTIETQVGLDVQRETPELKLGLHLKLTNN